MIGLLSFSAGFSQKESGGGIRLSHYVNTPAHEYLPIPLPGGKGIIFSAMDRTGYFDFKIDFTKAKTAGGEDIYFSHFKNGVLTDSRPITFLNTNGHETASYCFADESLLVVGNYSENIGPSSEGSMEGANTTDLFKAKKSGSGYQVMHYPEPLNSIFGEFDAISNASESYILFASDRPKGIGEYHKKGWLWNESFWGNTDLYVSFRQGNEWSPPINLGNKVNTPYAERSPWLSADLMRLYVSSNGYRSNKKDLDVYYFTRKSVLEWDKWEGPFEVNDINTEADEWGYKTTADLAQFFARSIRLNYQTTQKAGDAGFRETNFRSNYVVTGAQSAGLRRNQNTEIFFIPAANTPAVTLSDLLFDFNSPRIKSTMRGVLMNLVDLCMQNPEKKIKIMGYTDQVGSENYNLELSLKRAQAIEQFLRQNQVQNPIESVGMGFSPKMVNWKVLDPKKQRRVEVHYY
jgi:outer membrane protein OmpA-like peptidoglycan-associated protein